MCGLIDVADASLVSPLTCLMCIFRKALPLSGKQTRQTRKIDNREDIGKEGRVGISSAC